jgi:hypothetical protein
MEELSEKKKGIEELLEKIPPEKRWEITAKTLLGFLVLRGENIIAPEMGKGEGIIAPILGAEKWDEIVNETYTKGGKVLLPQMKEMFDIQVEDALGAAKLVLVWAVLAWGPDWDVEYFEKTPERVVSRITKCPIWEMYNEFEVDPSFTPCETGHQTNIEEGFKVINPKITHTLTKAMPRGDPYCEDVYEFKEE